MFLYHLSRSKQLSPLLSFTAQTAYSFFKIHSPLLVSTVHFFPSVDLKLFYSKVSEKEKPFLNFDLLYYWNKGRQSFRSDGRISSAHSFDTH